MNGSSSCTASATAAFLILMACSSPAMPQALTPASAPPDAPTTTQQATSAPEPEGAAQVTGIVQDAQGVPISAATVTLIPLGKLGERSASPAADGSFTFASLPASQYRLTVTAPGLDFYSSGEFTVRPDESVKLPAIVLKISTTTTVSVVASPQQVAVEQIHEQQQQRVFGVFQNFYTSYIWDAQPMPVKQKYTLALRTLIDPAQFFIVAGLAGAEQYNGTFPGYGPGIQGYGKRYGASLADEVDGRIIGSAILPSILHQDPRYFYQGSGSIGSRAFHAASFTFVARGDNGKPQPNFSHLLGMLAAAGISNAYHPAGSRGIGVTLQTFGIAITGNIIGNISREFLLRHIEKIPAFANGKQ